MDSEMPLSLYLKLALKRRKRFYYVEKNTQVKLRICVTVKKEFKNSKRGFFVMVMCNISMNLSSIK